MTLRLEGKRVNLPQLALELTTAGVTHQGLGTLGSGNDVELFTYDADGAPVDLAAGAQAVVTAHSAPLRSIDYVGQRPIERIAVTTTATPTEVARLTLAPTTAYVATARLVGVDAGNGAMRDILATVTAKRLASGALLVGAPVVLANNADALASSWAIGVAVSGNDLVVTVTGAAGRTINWFFRMTVDSFAPGGI